MNDAIANFDLRTPSSTISIPGSTVPVLAPHLFALGGSISVNRPLTLFPELRNEWLPVQCYVLRDGGSFLLLDTGITVHREAIARGIEGLIGDSSERQLVSTRREPDTIINLPWIVRDFGIQKVYAGGELSPLDFFDKVEEASVKAQFQATAGVSAVSLTPGAVITVGQLRLEVLRTTLRVLFTNWFYEEVTRTLFSSDSWGFLTRKHDSPPFLTEPAPQEISVEAIRRSLGTKFDWLRGIDTAPIIADLARLANERSIHRICPTYGGILEGPESVRRLFDNTIEALRQLGAQPRQSSIAGFDLARMREGA